MRNLCRILLAALVLPGLAALVATVPAGAADEPARVDGWSRTELKTSPGERVALRPKVSLHGRPAAGRVVVLQARSAGSPWQEVDRGRTDARGRARLAWTAPASVGQGALRVRSGTVTSATRAVRTAVTSPATPADAFRDEVLNLTNMARSQARTCGSQTFPAVGPLTRSAILDQDAQQYAEKMEAEGFFDHTAPDGSTMTSRAEAAGYTGWRALAENIARGQQSPQEVVDDWIASPGHCENLMNAQLKDLGIGYAATPATWVQDFGRR